MNSLIFSFTGYRRLAPILAMLGITFGLGPGNAFSQEMQETDGAVFRLSPGETRLTAAARLELGSREFRQPENTWDVKTQRATVRMSTQVLPATYIWGEFGGSNAQIRRPEGDLPGFDPEAPSDPDSPADFTGHSKDIKGDAGPAWGLGLGINLVEFILKESPVLGPLETFRLELQAIHRVSRSDLAPPQWNPPENGMDSAQPAKQTVEWIDSSVGILAIYSNNLSTDPTRPTFAPLGYAVRGGIRYSRDQTKSSYWTFESDRQFGVELGTDLHLRKDWLFRIEGLWLGSNQREAAFSVIRMF